MKQRIVYFDPSGVVTVLVDCPTLPEAVATIKHDGKRPVATCGVCHLPVEGSDAYDTDALHPHCRQMADQAVRRDRQLADRSRKQTRGLRRTGYPAPRRSAA